MEDWLKKLSPEERKKTNLEDHHALVAIKVRTRSHSQTIRRIRGGVAICIGTNM
jgi:hypothetical protein